MLQSTELLLIDPCSVTYVVKRLACVLRIVLNVSNNLQTNVIFIYFFLSQTLSTRTENVRVSPKVYFAF